MSGGELQQAAALMRTRAEAENSRGWHKVDFNEGDDPMYRPLWGVSNDVYFNPPADEDAPWLAVEIHTGTEATAEHIASWHPAVALAVADLLDAVAQSHEHAPDGTIIDFWSLPGADNHPALKVARAYLGTAP